MAASLIFPERIDANTDFDAHFFRYKRQVIGLITLIWLTVWGATLALGRVWGAEAWWGNAASLAALLFTLFARGPRANMVGLALLLANEVWSFWAP